MESEGVWQIKLDDMQVFIMRNHSDINSAGHENNNKSQDKLCLWLK